MNIISSKIINIAIVRFSCGDLLNDRIWVKNGEYFCVLSKIDVSMTEEDLLVDELMIELLEGRGRSSTSTDEIWGV